MPSPDLPRPRLDRLGGSSPGQASISCPGCSASTEIPVRHQPKTVFGFLGNRRSAWSEMAVRFRPSYTIDRVFGQVTGIGYLQMADTCGLCSGASIGFETWLR